MLGKDIVKLVVMKMDELTPFSSADGVVGSRKLLAGGDKLDEIKPVYTYISNHLMESGNEVLLAAPMAYLPQESIDSGSITPKPDDDDSCIGTIQLPIDYLRLHTLQMVGWQRPVHSILYPEDPRYSEQYNQWTRGTQEKPVVVYKDVLPKEITRIQYFSVNGNMPHLIKDLRYIPRFSNDIDYRSEIAELIALNCAKKIYGIYGMNEQVAYMEKEMSSILGLIRQ